MSLTSSYKGAAPHLEGAAGLSPQPTLPYQPYIDGVRALAVLAVLIYHLHGPWLPGGFAGVDVFFVLSGFVVSASIAGHKLQGLGRFFGYFYVRRITRIFPALIVCLLVTALFSALFIPGAWLSSINHQTGFYAFFGLSNFILAQSGRDYFAPATEYNPYTHTWSLAVEEQFYLVFPFLFIAWLAGGRGRRLSVGLFAVGLLSSVLFSAWHVRENSVAAFFLSPGRFWELAAGVLLYQWIGQRSDHARAQSWNWAAVLAVGLILASFVFSRSDTFPFPGALLAVVGTVGLIFCLHRRPGALHPVLGCAPLVTIGRISYSLYLWHWPVFVLFRWTCGLETLPTRVAAVTLAFVLAFASYHWIENPLRRSPVLRRAPKPVTIAAGLTAIALGSWGMYSIDQHQGSISLSQLSKQAEIWYPHGWSSNPDHPGCNADPEYHDVEGGLLLIYRPRGCEQLPAEVSTTLFVIGDSHSLAYEGMFKQYAMHTGRTLYAYNNGGCPFVSLQPWRDIDNPDCQQHIEAALRDLRTRIKPGDVLFLPSLRMPRLADQWGVFSLDKVQDQVFSATAVAGRLRAQEVAVETLREFTRNGIRVILEAPKPLFRAPPFRCADWFNRANPICEPGFAVSRAELEAYRHPVLVAFAEIARQLPGVTMWDPFPLLCSGERCSAWRNGQPLFLDGDHLSGLGNQVLLNDFDAHVAARLDNH
ncbi:acyltransferase family protein [Stutzerimonas stutzeri]|uniref:acyltransferase family protein n=1 Tax=Stutzerimonas stutzeri TaxID=316 RepID=UPI002108CEEA|nr:acyltransferase family protein [Stutzerimonas stutzeri]MCQ4322841.1 acyltransferase [Stutzerimonas stutzeri]